ncbi:MDR family MFS transporter [Mariniluteicoccus flavus]
MHVPETAAASSQTVDPTTPVKIRWDVIGLLLGAAFVVILNETTMAVALPALMSDLHVDAKMAQWLTTGFMLTMAVVIPVSGFIMDRLTTRQVFLTAMGLFSVGTLMAGFAPSFWPLLLARVVQASGTAIMMPLLMTTILVLVPIDRRGQVMGLVSVAMSMAPAMGPTLSGAILQFASWRMIFLVVLPIALVMWGLGFARMTNVGETKPTPVDPVSIVLSALGFGGLVYALSRIGEGGGHGGPAILIGAFAVSAIALALFVWRQVVLQRDDRPLLDLRTFRHRSFTLGIAIMMIAFMSLMGVVLLWPIYLQQVRGLSTMVTGLLLLPGGLSMGLLGPLIGRLFDRFGARPLVVPATIVLALSVASFTRVGPTTPIWILLAQHIILSLALSFIFTPVFTSSLNALPPHQYGHGSALLGTLQQVAGAAGAAMLITVMAEGAKGAATRGLPAMAAELEGLHLAFGLGALMASAAIVIALFLRTPKPVGAEPERELVGAGV